MAVQYPESSPVSLSPAEMDRLIAESQERLAGVNKLLEDR